MRSSWLVLLFVVGACGAEKPRPIGEVAAPAVVAPKPAPPRAGLWPEGKAPPDALATRVCKVVADVPAAARAKCCTAAAPVSFGDECVRLLSFALAEATVSVDEAALERCEKDSIVALSGCDWVTPQRTRPVPSCLDLVTGRVAVGGRCRSSLECTPGLHCAGLTPDAAGTCRAPSAVGQACVLAPDVFAAVSRQSEAKICEGFCSKRVCVAGATVADGAACSATERCGPRSFCDAGKCAPLRKNGEPCATPLQCEAMCTGGVCGASCDGAPRDKAKLAP